MSSVTFLQDEWEQQKALHNRFWDAKKTLLSEEFAFEKELKSIQAALPTERASLLQRHENASLTLKDIERQIELLSTENESLKDAAKKQTENHAKKIVELSKRILPPPAPNTNVLVSVEEEIETTSLSEMAPETALIEHEMAKMSVIERTETAVSQIMPMVELLMAALVKENSLLKEKRMSLITKEAAGDKSHKVLMETGRQTLADLQKTLKLQAEKLESLRNAEGYQCRCCEQIFAGEKK